MCSPAATVSGLGKLLSGGVTVSPALFDPRHTMDAVDTTTMPAMARSVLMFLPMVIDPT
jgi:hypothetical protein